MTPPYKIDTHTILIDTSLQKQYNNSKRRHFYGLFRNRKTAAVLPGL